MTNCAIMVHDLEWPLWWRRVSQSSIITRNCYWFLVPVARQMKLALETGQSVRLMPTLGLQFRHAVVLHVHFIVNDVFITVHINEWMNEWNGNIWRSGLNLKNSGLLEWRSQSQLLIITRAGWTIYIPIIPSVCLCHASTAGFLTLQFKPQWREARLWLVYLSEVYMFHFFVCQPI